MDSTVYSLGTIYPVERPTLFSTQSPTGGRSTAGEPPGSGGTGLWIASRLRRSEE